VGKADVEWVTEGVGVWERVEVRVAVEQDVALLIPPSPPGVEDTVEEALRESPSAAPGEGVDTGESVTEGEGVEEGVDTAVGEFFT